MLSKSLKRDISGFDKLYGLCHIRVELEADSSQAQAVLGCGLTRSIRPNFLIMANPNFRIVSNLAH